MINQLKIDKSESVFKLWNDDFEFLKFHQPHLSLIFDICKNTVFMQSHKFHNSSFFNKEKIFSFGPSVFQSIAEKLSLIVG